MCVYIYIYIYIYTNDIHNPVVCEENGNCVGMMADLAHGPHGYVDASARVAPLRMYIDLC